MSYFRFSTTETGLASPFATMSPSGLITWWNGTAFETYASGNWSTYDIALTEDPPGIYSGEWPTGINSGYYDLFLYETIGGTAATDRLVGSGTEYCGAATTTTLPRWSAEWYLAGTNETDNSTETITIDSADTVVLAFNFGDFKELQSGSIVSTAVITSTAGLTIGTVSTGSCYAVAEFSGTAATYTVTVTASFSNGTSIVRTRLLVVS